jgi:hypothetical protein
MEVGNLGKLGRVAGMRDYAELTPMPTTERRAALLMNKAPIIGGASKKETVLWRAPFSGGAKLRGRCGGHPLVSLPILGIVPRL